MTAKEAGIKGLDVAALDYKDGGFKGKNYLFAIGIDSYKHWDDLNCAVKDIEDFTELLLERYQFRQEYITILKNEEGTRKNILNKLREITQKITDEDNLILYFSGHGHYDEVTESGFWIPFDAELGYENEDDFLDTATIVHKLRFIDTKHTFLIIDACFSGTLLTQIKSAPRDENYKSRKVFTSGRAEVVFDGPKGGNSPFAKGLLTGLKRNIDPYYRASSLITYVKEYVGNAAKQTPVDGTWPNSGHEGGDFYFHLKLEDQFFWKDTLKINTPDSYHQYLANFPKGKYVNQAKKKIRELEDGKRGYIPGPDFMAWIKIQRDAVYRDYLNFIKAYPDSQFVPEAEEEMTKLDNIAFNKINIDYASRTLSREEKINACESYFRNYPNSKNEHMVRIIRNKLHLEP
ncbi:MAG TPA: caspase family protein [Pricia sp.]|nr:caspase family protein [Pricia sp.]